MRTPLKILLAVLLALALSAALYFVPPIHSRLAWRLANWITQIHYTLNPPDQAVFVPLKVVDTPASAAPQPGLIPTVTLVAPTAEPTLALPGQTSTPAPSFTPAPSATPLPAKVILSGLKHEYQTFNNCGPANLSMALTFWGWQGDQRVVQAVLRPNQDDANVMPYELVDFARAQTGLNAVLRYGGDLDTLRRFVAAGFPVIIEMGHQPSGDWWLGHYVLVSGYEDGGGYDGTGYILTQNSLIMPDLPVPYREVEKTNWRDFNYTYLVVFPSEREAEVMALLGASADPQENYRLALLKAQQEADVLEGRERFFAHFNQGANLLALGDVPAAAAAYDQAFALYPQLEEKQRPWRVMWYQTGAYQAYYLAGRYQDVLNLANSTLARLSKRGLEESHYWRGMAYEALGQKDQAVADYEIALKLRPAYEEAQAALKRVQGE